ncbi:hypothetical protein F5Y17DRAFT_459155 [Xylariaceae sp. FL0594]|nr:hypothetical protein F5Y17DRAFT_459155 [Xylariaceae sp. FL0594]
MEWCLLLVTLLIHIKLVWVTQKYSQSIQVRALDMKMKKTGSVDVDHTSDDCDNDTPLMVAITQARDPKLISLLTDAGAALDGKTNNDGKTARELAEESGDARIMTAIGPKDDRALSRPELINAIVLVIQFILSYINSGVLQGVVKGVVTSLYHITKDVPKDSEVAREVAEPTTVEDFQKNINTYVEDTGIGEFFEGNPQFLQEVAEKAARLKEDENNLLTEEHQIKDLTTLALHHTIIFADDSRSMGHQGGQRLESQKELILRMARIATKLTPDGTGVELNFINNNNPHHNLDEDGIKAVLDRMTVHTLKSGTPIGTRLRQNVLQPHVYDKLQAGIRLQRPLLILIITDGWPTGERSDRLHQEIGACISALANAGYDPEVVRFGVNQIGNERAAREFLDGLAAARELDRVLHVTAKSMDSQFDQLRENEKNLES